MRNGSIIQLPTGKLEARDDKRTLSFSQYRKKGISLQVPETFGHQSLIKEWLMLGNDSYGDCVFAGAAHETMLWNTEAKKKTVFNDTCVLKDYSSVTGFNPVDPNSDNGTVVLDALNYRRKSGIRDIHGKRHKLGGFAKLKVGNIDELKQAIYLFSGIGCGIAFPDTAMLQFNQFKPWSVVSGAKLDGGHYTPYVAYDKDFLYCVTWARVQPVAYSFYQKYCDEVYALLSTEMLIKGRSLEGFDLPHLQSDIAAFTAEAA